MSQPYAQGHALIIGVGADLPNTVDDAKGVSTVLTDPGRCAYPAGQVTTLTGEAATREAILGALDALATRTDPKSTVIVYYSGHGYDVSLSTGKAYYLMPFGYDSKQLHKTAISGQELTDTLGAIPAARLVVLLDCCHAGGIDAVRTKSLGIEMTPSPMPAEAQSLFSTGAGRFVIASSLAGELSYAGKPYSAFTLALLAALAGEGASQKDGYVRVMDLALYAREVVPNRTKNRQHPTVNFTQADNFRIAYYAGGDAEPKGLPYSEDEVEIEPEPGVFNQAQQTVQGNQANVASNTGVIFNAPNSGPIHIGDDRGISVSGGFYQPGWSVGGSVYQATGDILLNSDVARVAQDPIARLFAEVARQVRLLPADDQDQAQLACDKVRSHAERAQRGERGPEIQGALDKHLRRLYGIDKQIGRQVIAGLADGEGVAAETRAVAAAVKAEI